MVALPDNVILPAAEHIVWSPPALAPGAGVIVKVIVDVAFAQGEFPTAVKVNVMLPLVISVGVSV